MSVVEITMLRLAAGVSDGAFLAIDHRIQTQLVPNQPGFVRRTTARRGGEWLVVTLWASERDATAFERSVADDPLHLEFEHAAEAGTLHRARYLTLD